MKVFIGCPLITLSSMLFGLFYQAPNTCVSINSPIALNFYDYFSRLISPGYQGETHMHRGHEVAAVEGDQDEEVEILLD